jgi:hypothetical protein
MTTVTIGNLTLLPTPQDTTVFSVQNGDFTRKLTALSLKSYMSSLGNVIVSGAINAETLTANLVQARVIGNVGTILTGVLSTETQPNITSTGTLVNLVVSGTANIGGNVMLTGANLNIGGNLTSTNEASFSSINNTIIGNVRPQSARVTTLVATTLTAGTIGNSGAVLTGTLSSGAQNNITSATGITALGTITSLVATNFNTGNAVITGGSINNVTVGATTHTTGRFTTVTATTVNAGTIGNSGATLTGTLSTAAQNNITSVGTLTGLTVSGAIVPNANLTIDLGSTSAWFNNVYGVSIQAKYADLAEIYTADHEYPPGTVVCFGGSNEITTSSEDHTPMVAGVISTQPAYLMNAISAGLPVALSGRVPCLVQGPVSKGDRLVNIAPGVAGRLDVTKYVPGCVIGHALNDNESTQIKLIEVVIMKF